MGKLKLYDTSLPRDLIVRERMEAYQSLSGQKKMLRLLSLIRLSMSLNGGRPIKEPQGKGLVIARKK